MKKIDEHKEPFLLILNTNDQEEGKHKKIKRFIFDYGVEFNEYEKYKIEQLKAQAQRVLKKSKYPAWLSKEIS